MEPVSLLLGFTPFLVLTAGASLGSPVPSIPLGPCPPPPFAPDPPLHLKLVGFLDDHLQPGVLPEHGPSHLGDASLLLLLGGQWLPVVVLVCRKPGCEGTPGVNKPPTAQGIPPTSFWKQGLLGKADVGPASQKSSSWGLQGGSRPCRGLGAASGGNSGEPGAPD